MRFCKSSQDESDSNENFNQKLSLSYLLCFCNGINDAISKLLELVKLDFVCPGCLTGQHSFSNQLKRSINAIEWCCLGVLNGRNACLQMRNRPRLETCVKTDDRVFGIIGKSYLWCDTSENSSSTVGARCPTFGIDSRVHIPF